MWGWGGGGVGSEKKIAAKTNHSTTSSRTPKSNPSYLVIKTLAGVLYFPDREHAITLSSSPLENKNVSLADRVGLGE